MGAPAASSTFLLVAPIMNRSARRELIAWVNAVAGVSSSRISRPAKRQAGSVTPASACAIRFECVEDFGDDAFVNISRVAAGVPHGLCPLRPELEAARVAAEDGAATIDRAVRFCVLGIHKKQKIAAKSRGRPALLRFRRGTGRGGAKSPLIILLLISPSRL